ncbi:hypothetical protein MLD38_000557 [Melastoma candidum]|uniref:Uncharacterized protein n=1 Tax=Melastoma candidum TaxID=119954 RepID=A0ACB9SEE8_9MYRT|nr:hypothetical protein MLD38_000557 [Melastoma candidum]
MGPLPVMARFEGESHTLLENNNHHVKFTRNASHVQDELRSFRSYLRWMCVDQTTFPSACISWAVFAVFGLAVPAASHFLLACGECDAVHERPFDSLVQLSMTGVATLSFLCLSTFVRRYGLRRFLFFDKLWDESETVRRGYTQQLNVSTRPLSSSDSAEILWELVYGSICVNFVLQSSLKILLIFIIPSVLTESAYKIWWYASGASQIPFLGNIYASDTVACILEICSWLYRTTVIFLVCVLFRLVCSLQILRLQDFAQVFHNDSDVASMLSEHLRIRRHLRIISHRYRAFILWALIMVTISQFAALLVTTKSGANLNIFKAGELAVSLLSLIS